MLSVSVVINTYNRCATLRDTISSLQQLNYPRFEVVVVNGPSTDGTDEYLESLGSSVKVRHCPVRSLSVSRNIGICAASGDVIAFLDDDAVADARWLDALVAAYDDPSVGAVGGFVYDHTGYSYQCRYNIVDRYGVADGTADLTDQDQFCVPGGPRVLSTIGTNTSFRAAALRAVGGFDEAFMYYLDESDVCLRLVDAGYKVRIVPDALIYHRYAASFARTDRKVPTTLYPSAVCRSYYTYRNGLANGGELSKVLDHLAAFETMLDQANSWFRDNGWMPPGTYERLCEEVRRGMRDGAKLALTRPRALITHDQAQRLASSFRPFDRKAPRPTGGKQRICLISDGYPPDNYGGVARWTADLAAGLVALGHEAHVVTLGSGHPTVTYEDGVWLHRVVPTWQPNHPVRLPVDVPGTAAMAMLAVYDEVVRASADAPFDMVAWHVWENLGLAFLADQSFPCTMFIESAFGLIRPYKPQWQEGTEYGRLHVAKMVDAERYAYLNAPTVIAPSHTIVGEYDELAGQERTGRTVVIPLGSADPGDPAAPRTDGTVEVLYVGRLENRKGIDLLLAAVPGLCRRFPNVRFKIVGEDVEEAGPGSGNRAKFERDHAGADFWPQVTFTGRLSDAELKEAYAGCDVFVAPSRFESFGLIFVEAMAHGKPVVALAAGGVTEIVRDGVDGLLVPPDDAAALEEAVAKLVADRAFRTAASRMARTRYLQRFTIARMAADTAAAFRPQDPLEGLFPLDAERIPAAMRMAS